MMFLCKSDYHIKCLVLEQSDSITKAMIILNISL